MKGFMLCGFLVALLVVVAPSSATVLCRDHYGSRRALGSEWTYQCSKYRCESQGSVPIEINCALSNGRCIRNGETHHEGCTGYTCEVLGNQIRLRPDSACVNPMGGCIAIGSHANIDSCTRYECHANYNQLVTKRVMTGCKGQDGRCTPIGQLQRDGCIDYICHKYSNGDIGFTPHTLGCRKSTGECMTEGQVYWEDCNEFRCARQGNTMVTQNIGQKCKSAHNRCYSPGQSGFPCYIRNIYRDNCSCSTSPGGGLRLTAYTKK